MAAAIAWSSLALPSMGRGRRGWRRVRSPRRPSLAALSRLMARGIALLPVLAQSQSYSRTESYEYDDKAAVWVVDQVKKVTCVTTTQLVGGGSANPCASTVVPEATYDAKGSMLTYKSYGKLLQTLTYNPDGTVAKVKDGNNKIMTLGSWYRRASGMQSWSSSRGSSDPQVAGGSSHASTGSIGSHRGSWCSWS